MRREKRRLVPLAGFEPARCCHHQILSLARLPVPPQGQSAAIIAAEGLRSMSALTAFWVDSFATPRYAKAVKDSA